MTIGVFIILLLDLIVAPPAITSDKGAIVVSDKNKTVRWRAEWTMDPAEWQRRKAVRFTERGQGRVNPYQQEIRWSLEAMWSADGTFRPIDFEKTINTISGELLVTERKHFDRDKGSVLFERRFPGGRMERKTLSVPDDAMAIEGIAGVLRFLRFDPSQIFATHLLSNEPRLYNVTFEIRGKERVKTPAGEFDCYKVELVPHVGILNVFRFLYPKTFFWFTVAPPHFWVRYEGPENVPGSPEVVMELDRGGE